MLLKVGRFLCSYNMCFVAFWCGGLIVLSVESYFWLRQLTNVSLVLGSHFCWLVLIFRKGFLNNGFVGYALWTDYKMSIKLLSVVIPESFFLSNFVVRWRTHILFFSEWFYLPNNLLLEILRVCFLYYESCMFLMIVLPIVRVPNHRSIINCCVVLSMAFAYLACGKDSFLPCIFIVLPFHCFIRVLFSNSIIIAYICLCLVCCVYLGVRFILMGLSWLFFIIICCGFLIGCWKKLRTLC